MRKQFPKLRHIPLSFPNARGSVKKLQAKSTLEKCSISEKELQLLVCLRFIIDHPPSVLKGSVKEVL
jgi:hypothetical protein